LAYGYEQGEYYLKQDNKKACYYYEQALFALDKNNEGYYKDCVQGIKRLKVKIIGNLATRFYMIYFLFKYMLWTSSRCIYGLFIKYAK